MNSLRDLVRARHPVEKGWVVLEEVSDDHAIRRADVVAISCWALPFAVAYELKASRADWLREMDDPAKRAWAERVCRFRWFACEAGCAKPEELPAGWGIIEARGEGKGRSLRRVVAAPAAEVGPLPKWLCRSLLRGEELRRSLVAERDATRALLDATRALLDGERMRQEEAKLDEVRQELVRIRAEAAAETGRAEAFWSSLADLAGERAWTRNYGPARRDWHVGELWAVLQRRAAEQVREQAEQAMRACEALVAATVDAENGVSDENQAAKQARAE